MNRKETAFDLQIGKLGLPCKLTITITDEAARDIFGTRQHSPFIQH